MSKKTASPQVEREKPDPQESDRPWPLGVWIFLMLMVAWGTTYLALNSGDGSLAGGDRRILLAEEQEAKLTQKIPAGPKTTEQQIAAGKKVYESICSACHQATGQGMAPSFPPLAGSDWVAGSEQRLVLLVLHGLEGPIEVNGVAYNGVMPAHKDQFDDQQIADLITYIRKSWGNNFEPVKPETVAELRKKHATRSKAWTASEL